MNAFQWLVFGGVVSLLVVGFTHSYFGEKLLLAPMFKRRGNGVLESDLARFVLRGAWHLTTVMWLLMAVILLFVGFGDADLAMVVLSVIGIGFAISGVLDAVWSKGKHIGWPMLLAVGLFCLGAVWIA
ncbi:hypothetical protein [Planktotalea sp.]|uniref:hypothetical protein n=1 Tax=Planktotalea sp. TaxID=2029877 RepID=UPI0032989366